MACGLWPVACGLWRDIYALGLFGVRHKRIIPNFEISYNREKFAGTVRFYILRIIPRAMDGAAGQEIWGKKLCFWGIFGDYFFSLLLRKKFINNVSP
jgi:hypothetical protein